jgi:hypothetical protein
MTEIHPLPLPFIKCYCWETPGGGIPCKRPVYKKDRIGFVDVSLCKEHRFLYFSRPYPNHQILEDFCQPLDLESQGVFAHSFPALRNDVEFELKRYRKYRPAPYELHYDQVLEGVLRGREEYQAPFAVAEPTAPPTYANAEEGREPMAATATVPVPYEPARIPYMPLAPPPVATEQPLHNDAQNVHREEVIAAQSPLLFTLLEKNYKATSFERTLIDFLGLLDEIPGPRRRIRWWRRFLRFFTNFAKERRFVLEIQKRMGYDVTIRYLNTKTQKTENIHYKYLIWAAMSAILNSPHPLNRVDIAHRLQEEVLDGIPYCLAGSMTRILNAFTGFPEFGENDMRSAQEKLRDAFAELAKQADMPEAQKVQKGTSLLLEYKIPAAEHDVWIEPLRA